MNKLILAVLIAAFLLVLPVQATIYVGGDEGVTSISEAIALAKENEGSLQPDVGKLGHNSNLPVTR